MRLPALVLTLILALPVAAQEPIRKPDPVRQGPRVIRPAEAGVGKLIPDVAFTDLAGKAGKLSDFKDAKLTVVAFTNTTCPICKKYAPSARAAREGIRREGRRVPVRQPDRDRQARRPRLRRALRSRHRRHAHRRVRRDRDHGSLRPRCGAHGASIAARSTTSTASATRSTRRERSTSPPRSTTCSRASRRSSPRPTRPAARSNPTPRRRRAVALTYHARIERIVQANCVECHRTGGVAPFALETYEEVVDHKGMISKVVDKGTMPPWFAARRRRAKHSPFSNDRSLTDGDKKDLLAWLAGDLKKGDPADAPLPRKLRQRLAHRQAGRGVPASRSRSRSRPRASMPYQNVERARPTSTRTGGCRRLEVQPTAREVVHHVLDLRGAEGQRRGGEAHGLLRGVRAGQQHARSTPRATRRSCRRARTCVFQIHYTPNGKATTDQTKHRAGLREGSAAARGPRRRAREHEVPDSGRRGQSQGRRRRFRCRSTPGCWRSSRTPTCAARRRSTNSRPPTARPRRCSTCRTTTSTGSCSIASPSR